MENWSNYIKENRAFFDDREPEEGHFERFEERLNHRTFERKKARILTMKRGGVWVAAASAAVLILFGIRFFSSPMPGGKDFNEFYTTNDFYQSQMNEQIADIRCKLENADGQTREQLEKDLQNLRNENNHFVEKVKNDENEELVLFYLVNHYKTNIQALRRINRQLGKYIEC